ncbi:MAG: serine hydroxymethyltransferase, partial [Pirellula sp.]
TVNMNMIPFDTRKPMDPSGIRIGSPALTTRGMGVDEFKTIGGWIATALKSHDNPSKLEAIRSEVKHMTVHFPVPASGMAVAI